MSSVASAQISGTLIGWIRSKGVGLLQLPFSPTLCHRSVSFSPFLSCVRLAVLRDAPRSPFQPPPLSDWHLLILAS